MRIQFRRFTAGRRGEEEESRQVSEWLIKDDDSPGLDTGPAQNRRVHIIQISKLTGSTLFRALMRWYFNFESRHPEKIYKHKIRQTLEIPLRSLVNVNLLYFLFSPLSFAPCISILHNTRHSNRAQEEALHLLYRTLFLAETETFVWPPPESQWRRISVNPHHHHFLAEWFGK